LYVFYLVNLGLLIYDTPWGTLRALGTIDNIEWDIQVTIEGLKNVFKQVEALNTQDDYTVAIYSKPMDIHIVTECLQNRGFANITYLYWHKTDHNTPTPNVKYTSSVEIIVLGFKTAIQKCFVNLPNNPIHRHNFIECKAVSARLKDEYGQDCNPTEKPWALANHLASSHCAPGDTVLVVGAGAGGDMFGAAQAGRTVIAVEKDDRQFRILCKQMSLIAEQQKKVNLQEFGKAVVSQQVIPPTNQQQMDDGTFQKIPIVCVYCGTPAGFEGDGQDRIPCSTCGPGKHYCDKIPCSIIVGDFKYCSKHHSQSSNSSQEEVIPETQADPTESESLSQDLTVYSSTSQSF
jgi:hypothetical protein